MEVNIFIKTLTRFREHQTIAEIAKQCRKQLKINIFRVLRLQVGDIIRRFSYFQKKYYQPNSKGDTTEWREDEKKVFLCFLLAFCRLYLRKVSQITDREWGQVSEAFGNKNILVLKYQARVLQKCSERVRWHPQEELLLQSCIKHELDLKWSQVSKNLFLISKGQYYKTPKQCSQHWFNYLNKQIQVGQWNINEDIMILQTVLQYGHKWARIVDLLQKKRTQHMVKNRYFSILKSFITQSQQKNQKNQLKIVKSIINQLCNKASTFKNGPNQQLQSCLKIQQKWKEQIKQQQQTIYKQFYISDITSPSSNAQRNSKEQNSRQLYYTSQERNANILSNVCIKPNIEQQQNMILMINQPLLENSIFCQMNLLNSLNSFSSFIIPFFKICNDIVYPI